MLTRIVRSLRGPEELSLMNPRAFQPPLPIPAGFTKDRILAALAAVSIDGSRTDELVGYATMACERFLHTLGLVPENVGGRMLEIGANPYFTTLLLRRFRSGLRRSLVNYFGPPPGDRVQTVAFPGFDGEEDHCELPFQNVNIEQETLPYEAGGFDLVLFCEVLEHLTSDPLRALLEIKRVLKLGGLLVLTTPNAARLENVIAVLEGRNINDAYSGHGPYGRHNREYTRHDLHLLLEHAGFACEVSYTANVHDDIPPQSLGAGVVNKALAAIPNRGYDLGQYLMTRWRNVQSANEKLPSWLYRSYPAERVAV